MKRLNCFLLVLAFAFILVPSHKDKKQNAAFLVCLENPISQSFNVAFSLNDNAPQNHCETYGCNYQYCCCCHDCGSLV